MRTFVQKDTPLALRIFPHNELSPQKLERGGHGRVEIFDQGNGVPVIPPHKRLLYALVLLLLRSHRFLHADARLVRALGRVGIHRG